MTKKSKGTPYTVRATFMGAAREFTVHVPDDFDRVRGTHDTARDLAAYQLVGDGATWVPGASRAEGWLRYATDDASVSAPCRMVVECARVSPSGCPIEAGERVYPTVRYRVVKVGDRAFNARRSAPEHTIGGALGVISTLALAEEHDHWRVVELPAGEPWDYDGVVVADLRIGRGVA